jgi:hypothetical protein
LAGKTHARKRERKKTGKRGETSSSSFSLSSFLTDADANRHATPRGIKAIPTASRIAAACARVARPSQWRSSCCEKRESGNVFFFFSFFVFAFERREV